MSGYPGYPQQGQQRPPGNFPPPPGGGFPPPPGAGPGGQMYPQPPGMQPPPPGMQGQQAAPPPPRPGTMTMAPPPPGGRPVGGGGMMPSGQPPQMGMPPPPPGQQQGMMMRPGPPPPGQMAMQGLQQGMGGMNLGPKPGQPGAVPPPIQQQPPGGPPTNPQGPPRMSVPPPQPPGPGTGFAPQPPAQSFGYTQPMAPSPQPPAMMMQPGPTPQPMVQPGMVQPPGMAPTGDYFEENIDLNIQVPPHILRCSTAYIPQSASLAHATKVPLGAVVRPLAPGGEEVKVVQPGAAGIVRCKRCRTYINAFVTWLENGRCWRCNICAQRNECPAPYFCHLDENGRRRDKDQRPELSEGVVEFVAPSEYMVRPPQPPSYFFVIDVSVTSVRSGMLKSLAAAISNCLDELPGSPRTQVGFITYDDSVHYYSFKAGLANPQMLVVADLVELFVPAPDDLLVNLQESREVVDIFLENLPNMFAKTTCQSACLGPALKAAFTVTKHIGGKMCVFQSVLPTLGDGTLVPRENYQIMGTPDEVKLLRPAQNWYKDTAIEFSRAQICVDMFLFPRAYIDVASLGDLPKLTSGTLRTYPGFHYETDGPRFESELCRSLTQNTAFEAVMRIRCTRGMRITNFYGNFFIRGTDLLALPNCNADSTFAFDLVHDEQNLNSSVVTVQSALLYTSSEGERRIRVITQALPVTSMASDVIQSVDVDALTCLLAKQGLDVAIKTNLDSARGKLQQVCVDMIRASKEGDKPRTISGYAAPPPMHQQQQGQEEEKKPVPENLKLLPLYTLALIKNVALRGGTDIHPDERVHAMHRLTNMWVTDSKHFVYPRMFSLHDMSANAGLPSNIEPTDGEDEKVAGQDSIELPNVLNLTVDRLASNGIFLLDNGLDMLLWVGRSSDPSIVNSLFGTNSLEGVDMSQIKLRTSGNDFASRLNNIVSALREDAMPQSTVAKVTIVREGDHGLESRFFWHMVEDSASFNGGTFSYSDFMEFVHRPPGAQGGPPGMPPGGGRGPPPPPGGQHGPPGQMQRGPPGQMPPGPPGQMPAGPPGQMPAGPPGPMPPGPSGPMPPGPPGPGQMHHGPPGHMPSGPPPPMQQGPPGHMPPPPGPMRVGPSSMHPPGQQPQMNQGPPPPQPPMQPSQQLQQGPPPPRPPGPPQQVHQLPPPPPSQYSAQPGSGSVPHGGAPSGSMGGPPPGPPQMQSQPPQQHRLPPSMNQQMPPQGPPSVQYGVSSIPGSGPPPSSGSYGGPPPSSVGYGGPPTSSVGYGGPPTSSGGYGGPPTSSGGYGGPPPSSRGYGGPPPSSGGYGGPPPSSGGYGGPPMQHRPPPPPRPNMPPPPQQYHG